MLNLEVDSYKGVKLIDLKNGEIISKWLVNTIETKDGYAGCTVSTLQNLENDLQAAIESIRNGKESTRTAQKLFPWINWEKDTKCQQNNLIYSFTQIHRLIVHLKNREESKIIINWK